MGKGLNSIIILGAWNLWKHRNRCMFDGASPNLMTTLINAKEAALWSLAGARGITFLQAQQQEREWLPALACLD